MIVSCGNVWIQTTNDKRQTTTGKRQTANGKRQTANGKRQTANGKRQTANGKRQTTNDKRRSITLCRPHGASHCVIYTQQSVDNVRSQRFLHSFLPQSHLWCMMTQIKLIFNQGVSMHTLCVCVVIMILCGCSRRFRFNDNLFVDIICKTAFMFNQEYCCAKKV